MDLIVVDTSALVAILLDEADARVMATRLETADRRLISAANYVELGAVLAGRDRIAPATTRQELDRILTIADIELAAINAEQSRIAVEARIRFGKGFGVPAGLNFGDCFAYALAKAHAAPLLYVGQDFSRTDLVAAHKG